MRIASVWSPSFRPPIRDLRAVDKALALILSLYAKRLEIGSKGGLQAQGETQPAVDLNELLPSQLPDAFLQQRSVDGDHLGHIDDRVLG